MRKIPESQRHYGGRGSLRVATFLRLQLVDNDSDVKGFYSPMICRLIGQFAPINFAKTIKINN